MAQEQGWDAVMLTSSEPVWLGQDEELAALVLGESGCLAS